VVDGPKLLGKVCTKCGECIKVCPTHAVHEDLKDFERIRCCWGANGLYKATGLDNPPKEWLEAGSVYKAMELMPKLQAENPAVAYYRGLSVKYMGYPNCLQCYQHCTIGIKSSEELFGCNCGEETK